jgi:diguanylate cyclase (GGDEF)-like protein
MAKKVKICIYQENTSDDNGLFESLGSDKYLKVKTNDKNDLASILSGERFDVVIIYPLEASIENCEKIKNSLDDILGIENSRIFYISDDKSEMRNNDLSNDNNSVEILNLPLTQYQLSIKLDKIYNSVIAAGAKVLVVDDNNDERVITQYLLKQMGMEMIEAENGEDAKKYLYEEYISLVILDLYMPVMDGFETCRMLKSREAFKHVPVIALTSSENSNDLKRMLEAGANDFIRKPFLFEEFIARVRAQLRLKEYFDHVQDHIAEEEKLNMKLLEVNHKIKVLNEKLEQMAVTDYLTNIYNRRYTLEYMDKEIERAIRYDTSFCVALFDIDHFKDFNDTHGHQVGDEVLKHFCDLVLKNTRKSDTFGRYGGEEFLLILPNCNLEVGYSHSEKLRELVELNILKTSGKELQITVSGGVSEYSPGDKPEEIIKRADDALLDAKREGRNRILKR